MVGALLVTHGRLGEELLEAARKIVGEVRHMSFVSLGWHDEVDESRKRIEEALESLDTGQGVLVLTDMFGGTPANLSLPLLEKDRCEIVTGVNLPMVIKVADQSAGVTLAELARRVRDQGQKHISVASEVLGE